MQSALTELNSIRGQSVAHEDNAGQLRSQITRLEAELHQTRIRFTESQSALNAAECEKARLLACLRTVDGFESAAHRSNILTSLLQVCRGKCAGITARA